MAYTKQRIQLRRDTEAAWRAANPTLLPGEFAFDTTNKWIKVGTGTNWESTPYVHISADFVDGLEDKNDNTIYCLSNVTDAGFDFMSADGTAAEPVWTKLTGFTAKDWTNDITTAAEAAKNAAIAEATLSVNAEAARAEAAEEALAGQISDEQERAEGAESNLEAAIAAEAARATAKEDEIDAAVADVVSDVEALDTRMGSAETEISELDENKADKTALNDYIPLSAANTAVTEDNKVATMADVAGLSGAIHFRGAFTNDEADSGKTDKQAFIDAYAPVVAGDIAINTANSKEYLAISGDAETPATSADIRELGDEGIYATKAELAAAIAALSADEVTLEPSETVASVKEENGVITVTKQNIQIGMDQVTGLDTAIEDAIEAAEDYADGQDAIVSAATKTELIGAATDLSSVDTVYGAKAYAKDYADAKAMTISEDVIAQAKAYTDEVSAALSDAVAETYLSASEVEGKVALSTLAEVEAALTGFIKDVKVAGSSVVQNQVANLGAMAGKDAVTEADLSGWFEFDCGGAVLPD